MKKFIHLSALLTLLAPAVFADDCESGASADVASETVVVNPKDTANNKDNADYRPDANK